MSAVDVDERAFRFLCEVIRFARTIEPEPGVRRLIDQLVAATGSVGANRQEATGASWGTRRWRRYFSMKRDNLRGYSEQSLSAPNAACRTFAF